MQDRWTGRGARLGITIGTASGHVLAAGLTLLGVAGLVLAFTGASTTSVATVGGVAPGFWLLGGGAAAVMASRRSRERQAV